MNLRQFLFLTLSVVSSGLTQAETIQTLDAALKASFPHAAAFVTETVQLEPQVKSESDKALGRQAYDAKTIFISAIGADGSFEGCAFVEDELGKHQPITFLVALDAQDRVLAVQLLIYREAQGGEVRSRRFRSQFMGKRHGDLLRLNAEVDAVSGATISSSTLAFGVRRALHLRALVAPFNRAAMAPSGSMKGKTP